MPATLCCRRAHTLQIAPHKQTRVNARKCLNQRGLTTAPLMNVALRKSFATVLMSGATDSSRLPMFANITFQLADKVLSSILAAGDHLFLPLVELPAEPIIELRLVEVKGDPTQCRLLRFQDGLREVDQPGIAVQAAQAGKRQI